MVIFACPAEKSVKRLKSRSQDSEKIPWREYGPLYLEESSSQIMEYLYTKN